MRLRPFFRYYGGKWRAVSQGKYPHPTYDTIIEPFAGAAGYALHHPSKHVVLVERYHVVAEIWRWMIGESETSIRSIPLVDDVNDLPANVPHGARWLIGFSMNTAIASPRKTLSSGLRRLREQGRKFYGWTEAMRERVASQVQHIRHWQVIEGDYSEAPDLHATWFIDPPYQAAGSHYVHGSSGIDYTGLADWCRGRNGQTIVCEHPSASWLPFRPIGAIKSGPRTRSAEEAVWP